MREHDDGRAGIGRRQQTSHLGLASEKLEERAVHEPPPHRLLVAHGQHAARGGEA
jgi:hypothetical protein